MVFIADYLALGLVFILCLFYFDQNRFLTKASRWFGACIILTGFTTALDLQTGFFMDMPTVPLWLNIFFNSLYFLFNGLTTTAIAMFLFCKILEHVYDPHCMKNAIRAMSIILAVFCAFILANLFTGWLFYFDEAGNYQRGPLNGIGYFTVVAQMFFVLVCYIRNRKSAPRSMRNALIQVFPVGLVCIVIQRTYPDIMLNGILLTFADLVLFLNFQGQRQGINSLTKLKDRSCFFSELQERLDKKETFQILLINLKHFGDINQKYSHKIGDEALYQYANALESMFSNSNAYHMNGTVFVLALPYTCPQAAASNALCVSTFLDNGVYCAGNTIRTDHIVVDYIVHDSQEGISQIFKQMEYASKTGFQQHLHYILWDESMKKQMLRKQYLTERMQTVDAAHGFQVHYQPIYCLRTERFCSCEALVRLYEPDGSCISPAEFIPLAEQTGLIQNITWFVLEEVCKFLSSYDLPLKAVSVNLPMTHMLHPDFLMELNALVDRYGVDRSRIHLEFTERETLEDYDEIKRTMTRIINAGYKFYLDDFGTGYSNFSCILQLPFYGVKLDRSLSDNISDLQSGSSLVGTLTHMLHSMGFLVITEGAETVDQVEAHCRYDVDRIQGYYYAKPMDAEAIKKFYHVF